MSKLASLLDTDGPMDAPPAMLGWRFDEAAMRLRFLAKIPSACIFIIFQLSRGGRFSRLLTVKLARYSFNFQVGWSFSEAQVCS
jgi:hypothetical protein